MRSAPLRLRTRAEAKDALRLLFLRETAAAYPDELRKIIGMGFSLEQSCAALGACKDTEQHTAEIAVSLLLTSLAEGTPLPTPSAVFRGRVTDLLRSGEYISEADAKMVKTLRAQEQRRLVKTLHAANVQDGTRTYKALSASAKALLTEHFMVETASAFPNEIRKLLELGFTLRDAAAALGSCLPQAHALETSVCRLLEADCLRSFDTERSLPCPSVSFRSRVTDLLRSGDYVSESAAREEQKWLLLVLKQCGVSDRTLSWAHLPDRAQDAFHQVFMRQTAAAYPRELRQLLTLGFPLVGCCAALGSCSLQPGSAHIIEICTLRLLDDTVPLWAPSSKFRGRITDLLRSGAYVSADTEAKLAEAAKQENKRLLAVLGDAHVRDGSRSWSALSTAARSALHKHMIALVASDFPHELRKLMQMGLPLPAAAAALYSCDYKNKRSSSSSSKTAAAATGEMMMLNSAFNYILAAPGRAAATAPPPEFRGRVTRLLRSGAYIHIAALCAPDIGELEAKLCRGGLLSPTATPPGSPAREIPSLPHAAHKYAAEIVMPDLRLSKGGAVVRSSSAEGQIRILKTLYEEGVLGSSVYSTKASKVMDRVDEAAAIDLGTSPWHIGAEAAATAN